MAIEFGSPSWLHPFVARYDPQYQNPFGLISRGLVIAVACDEASFSFSAETYALFNH